MTLNEKLTWLAKRKPLTLNLDPWKSSASKFCERRDETFIVFYSPVESVCSSCYRKAFGQKQPPTRGRHYDTLLTKINIWLTSNISIVSKALDKSKFSILSEQSPAFRVLSPAIFRSIEPILGSLLTGVSGYAPVVKYSNSLIYSQSFLLEMFFRNPILDNFSKKNVCFYVSHHFLWLELYLSHSYNLTLPTVFSLSCPVM